MTDHEFVTFVRPAVHAALFDTNGVTGSSQFCFKELEAFTDVTESPTVAEPSQRGDDEDVRLEESLCPSQT
jgi:hypothetical protein